MTTSITSRSDALIQLDVAARVANNAQIGVSVHQGVVTLFGGVDTQASRIDAKDAALCALGVTVVVNEIVVGISIPDRPIDAAIAVSIKHLLDWSANLPYGQVQAEVRDQVVILTGVVMWDHQRRTAASAIRGLIGGLEIDNLIELTSQVSAWFLPARDQAMS